MYDLIIKNGMIVDGSGSKAFPGEVAVKDGKIAAVKNHIDEPSVKAIDAKGHYVAPGFIDMHRHADAAVFRDNFGELEVRQGITSIINGQCGLSIVPCPSERRSEMFNFLNTIVGSVRPDIPFNTFAEYTAQVKKQHLPINVGCCIGNGAVRMATAGFANGKLTEKQIRIAQDHIRASIEAGALGSSPCGILMSPWRLISVEKDARSMIPNERSSLSPALWVFSWSFLTSNLLGKLFGASLLLRLWKSLKAHRQKAFV